MSQNIRDVSRAFRDISRAFGGLAAVTVSAVVIRPGDQIEVGASLYRVVKVDPQPSGAVFIDALLANDTGSVTLRAGNDTRVQVYRRRDS